MGFLDSVRAWFKTEAAEARDVGRRTKGRLEADLDRREAELNLTPEQRLEKLQEQIDTDSSLGDLQDKIEGRGALADATAEVRDLTKPGRDGEDVMDLESEEIIPPEPPEQQPPTSH